MIGKIKYYSDSQTYINNGRLEDFILEYYIDSISSKSDYNEHCIIKYTNNVNGRILKLSMRKVKGSWFKFYYVGLVENSVTISGLSDLKAIYEIYNGFLLEIKTLEASSYNKLKEDAGKIKSASKELESQESYSETTHSIICDLFSRSCKLSQALEFQAPAELYIPMGRHKIFLEWEAGEGGDVLVLRMPNNRRSIKEVRLYLDENEDINIRNS